jgi:hypothetical protein
MATFVPFPFAARGRGIGDEDEYSVFGWDIIVNGRVRPGASCETEPDYNPEATAAASSFNSFHLGVALKIASASIAKDGTITTTFTLTHSAGASGFDRDTGRGVRRLPRNQRAIRRRYRACTNAEII